MQGAADLCTCDYCKNYREQRKNAFPEEIKILFEKLGINFNEEAEVSEVYKLENGLHNYLGWFHFAGKIVAGKRCKDPNSLTFDVTQINENFWIGFYEESHLSSFKRDIPLIQVEFQTNLPWIIEGLESDS